MAGEVELLTIRRLQYVAGHDSSGLVGRAGSIDHPGYIVGNWYLAGHGMTLSAGAAPGNGSIRAYPAYIKHKITLDTLGVRIGTIQAGGNIQAAIYANNFATMRPTGNALASTASMSTASAASVNAAISVQLEPGLYWFATNSDNGTSIPVNFTAGAPAAAWLIGSSTQATSLGANVGLTGVSVAQAFGTWPDLTAGSFVEVAASSIPVVQFKVASVP